MDDYINPNELQIDDLFCEDGDVYIWRVREIIPGGIIAKAIGSRHKNTNSLIGTECDFVGNGAFSPSLYRYAGELPSPAPLESDPIDVINRLVEPFVKGEWLVGRLCAVGAIDNGVVITLDDARTIRVTLKEKE